jgi:hypothetical protein
VTALGPIALDGEEVPAPSDLAGHLWIEPGAGPIYARAAREAGLTLPV